MAFKHKKRATDGRLWTPLIWTLAALGAGLAPHIRYLPVWISLLALAFGAWRLLIEFRRWHLPPALLRLPVALLAFVGVLFVYRSINGIAPGTALLVVMAALKLLETGRRRDLHVILFISLFLVLASLLREQTPWSLPYLAAALVIITGGWVNAARSGGSLAPAVTIRVCLRILAHALPLMVVFWILFPRVPGPFWAIPTNARGSATTGISDTLSPGDISQLGRNDAVAFRVRFESEVPEVSELYWRGLIMTNFDGRTWKASEPGYTSGADRSIEARGEATRYSVTLEPTDQHWLFALEMPKTWEGNRIFMAGEQQLTRVQPIDERTIYSVESYTDYSLTSTLTPGGRRFLARLPVEYNPRSTALARQMRAAAGSDRSFIDAVLEKFRREQFYYTLEPPPLGEHSVDEFLFSTRRGFCEHYASAFAVLARAAGIPTRIVAGYHGGEMNPIGNYMIVRQSNAHAWTEVWIEGDGWLRVDPTAAVALSRIESGLDAALEEFGEDRSLFILDSALFRNVGLTWDAVNARWDEWVLGYGPETQAKFMRWLGMRDPRWETLVSVLFALTLLTLAATAIGLAWRFRRPPPDAAHRAYLKLIKALKYDLKPHESPRVFYTRAVAAYPQHAAHIREAVERYQALRYAGTGTESELQRCVKLLIRRVRREPVTATRHR